MRVKSGLHLFGWEPRVDVIEGISEITVKAKIPCYEAKDIEMMLDGRTLTIS